jgi:hypothetical protein
MWASYSARRTAKNTTAHTRLSMGSGQHFEGGQGCLAAILCIGAGHVLACFQTDALTTVNSMRCSLMRYIAAAALVKKAALSAKSLSSGDCEYLCQNRDAIAELARRKARRQQLYKRPV